MRIYSGRLASPQMPISEKRPVVRRLVYMIDCPLGMGTPGRFVSINRTWPFLSTAPSMSVIRILVSPKQSFRNEKSHMESMKDCAFRILDIAVHYLAKGGKDIRKPVEVVANVEDGLPLAGCQNVIT